MRMREELVIRRQYRQSQLRGGCIIMAAYSGSINTAVAAWLLWLRGVTLSPLRSFNTVLVILDTSSAFGNMQVRCAQ